MLPTLFVHIGVKDYVPDEMESKFFIPSPTKLRRDIVTLPSIRPSVTSL
jgi:hypothetical protein